LRSRLQAAEGAPIAAWWSSQHPHLVLTRERPLDHCRHWDLVVHHQDPPTPGCFLDTRDAPRLVLGSLANGDASLYSPGHDTVRCVAHKAHDQNLLDRVRIFADGAIERGSEVGDDCAKVLHLVAASCSAINALMGKVFEGHESTSSTPLRIARPHAQRAFSS